MTPMTSKKLTTVSIIMKWISFLVLNAAIYLSPICLYTSKSYKNSYFDNWPEQTFDSFKDNLFHSFKGQAISILYNFLWSTGKDERLLNPFSETRKTLKPKYKNQQNRDKIHLWM